MLPYFYFFEVSRVLDGDTFTARIDLGFRLHMDATIRLLGIDSAPATTSSGVAASRFAQQFFDSGGKFILESCGWDSFGRVLGRAWRANSTDCLNVLLVNAKLAESVSGRVKK